MSEAEDIDIDIDIDIDMTTERGLVAEASERLSSLTPGTTGNLSVRNDDYFCITPTGVRYGEVEAEDVPVMNSDGEKVKGELEPSSETPMHSDVYEEFGSRAVLHLHSPAATTVGVLREEIPAVHYAVGLAGGRVPLAEYATYGTPELGENVVEAMKDEDRDGSKACVIPNHGLVVRGDGVEEVFETAVNVEFTAEVYLRAKAVGDPVELSDDEIEKVIEKFKGHGQ
ncbi:MAG: class II aldolase/adducin family protein [Halobacteria archaeon]|nr:class II aldolase/adducin family protein [Halobacteria archaeon]